VKNCSCTFKYQCVFCHSAFDNDTTDRFKDTFKNMNFSGSHLFPVLF